MPHRGAALQRNPGGGGARAPGPSATPAARGRTQRGGRAGDRADGQGPAARPASAGLVAARAGRLRDAITTGTAILLAPPQETLPVTLAGLPLPDPPPAPPRPRVRTGHLARAAALAAAGIVAAALAVVLLAGLSGPAAPQRHRPASAVARMPDARRPAVSSMVEVNGGSLAGQPVATVRRQLRQLGLTVRVLWQPSDLQPPARSCPPGQTARCRPAA